jgi:hypothetical protein
MRKLIYPAICGVLALTILLPATAASARDGLDYLPEEVQGLLIVRNLASMYDVLGITDLRKERPDLFAEIDKDVMDEVGFNPLDVASLDRLGLETGKPMYLAWFPEPSSCVVALLPGEKTLLDSFNSLQEDEAGQVVVDRDGDVEIYGGEDDEVVFFHEGSYLFIVSTVVDEEDEVELGQDGDGPQSALAAARELRKQAKKNSLKKSKLYKSLRKKVTKKADIQLYSGEGMNKVLMEMSEDEELSEHGMAEEDLIDLYEKWGILNSATLAEVTIGADRIAAEGYTRMGKDSAIRDWYGINKDPKKFLGRVPSDPLLMILSRLNSAALYSSIKELMALADPEEEGESFDDQLDDAGEDMGMDLETDLFDQIDGNFGILVNRVQLMGSDAVALVQLADPDAFYDTVDGIAGWIELSLNLKKAEQEQQQPSARMTEEEFGGVDYYKVMMPPMMELCFGIVEDHFVVAMSELRFQSVVTGDGSFVKTIGNERVASTLDDPSGSVFYIDFKSLSRDLLALAPMVGIKDVEMFEVMGELSELTSVTKLEGDGMQSDVSLTSAKPDVWKRLIAWLLEEAAEEEAKKAGQGQSAD